MSSGGGSARIPFRQAVPANLGRAGQHGSNDGQQAGVFLQSGGVGKKPIPGQGADGLIVGPDGHADEGNGILAQIAGSGAVEEERIVRHVGNDHGASGTDNRAGDAFSRRIVSARLFRGIEPV